ncbi:probable F-box protein At4g22030 [Amaranthus tricolor]|uniref:probable F-box protein At4g22030 n=1 Tax=Amaranthus tricolor TaxID=29722 RepID=UPI002586EDDA|nr:probable F-box protein At4g22030 [Amaranthus tricolor]
MVSIQASIPISSSSRSSLSLKTLLPPTTKHTIKNALNIPKYLTTPKIKVPKQPSPTQKKHLIQELNKLNNVPLIEAKPISSPKNNDQITAKIYAILEAISDRIEMHKNIGDQRDNWNSLLLNSVNMMTLTAATMAGFADVSGSHGVVLRVSSTLLFLAGTGIIMMMNKIQPSQLVEEQRNAVRLLKKLQTKIQNSVSIRKLTNKDVDNAVEEVIALDRAYPLPLLGSMLEKFPESLEPAKWWPSKKQSSESITSQGGGEENGWSQELEDDMREVVGVTKRKDIEDYIRLGNKALKLNKMLAVTGPVLTGIAAVGAAFVGHGGPWAGIVAAAAGSMAAVVNTLEHGGQVGMVFEMYRNCAGSFKLLEESVEYNLGEEDYMMRKNGEVFELEMALKLGRNVSDLRDFADKSRTNGGNVEGFASKLF